MTNDQAIAKALQAAEYGTTEVERVQLFKASLREQGFMVLPLISIDLKEG